MTEPVKCEHCERRRAGLEEAISKGDAIKAAMHAMLGLAEMTGLKKKPETDAD